MNYMKKGGLPPPPKKLICFQGLPLDAHTPCARRCQRALAIALALAPAPFPALAIAPAPGPAPAAAPAPAVPACFCFVAPRRGALYEQSLCLVATGGPDVGNVMTVSSNSEFLSDSLGSAQEARVPLLHMVIIAM